MTKPNLDAIRKRCDAATPGDWILESPMAYPWIVSHPADDGPTRTITANGFGVMSVPLSAAPKESDWVFIAHARADIPALLEYVAELERRVDELQDELLHVLEEQP